MIHMHKRICSNAQCLARGLVPGAWASPNNLRMNLNYIRNMGMRLKAATTISSPREAQDGYAGQPRPQLLVTVPKRIPTSAYLTMTHCTWLRNAGRGGAFQHQSENNYIVTWE